MLKTPARDAVTALVVLVCVCAAVVILFVVTYGLIVLIGGACL